jgi:hypothetical protein
MATSSSKPATRPKKPTKRELRRIQERSQRRQLLRNRLSIIARRFDTTIDHVMNVCVAIALSRLEKLSLVEFQKHFGQALEAQMENVERKKRLKKIVDEAERRQFRVLSN